jgi:hypothetical protein
MCVNAYPDPEQPELCLWCGVRRPRFDRYAITCLPCMREGIHEFGERRLYLREQDRIIADARLPEVRRQGARPELHAEYAATRTGG